MGCRHVSLADEPVADPGGGGSEPPTCNLKLYGLLQALVLFGG